MSTYEHIDPSEVPAEKESQAVAMAYDLVAGLTIFVPKGGPAPALHVLRADGRLRRQRRMERDGIQGTAYWAVEDPSPRRY